MSIKDTRRTLGQEAYHWPEFKALCLRLGIAWDDTRTRAITVRVAVGEVVTVNHEFIGSDESANAPT